MNDQEWRRARGFIAWGEFGLIILVGVSIIASLLFFGTRSQGTFYPYFPGYFFPFHFGWLIGGVFIVLLLFLIARWVFLPWRNGNLPSSYSRATIDKYIKDAQNANRQDLIEMWQIIKKDRQRHLHMLKEALEKEIHG